VPEMLEHFQDPNTLQQFATGTAGACNMEKIEVAKPAIPTVTGKRESEGGSEQKKVKSYKEVDGDAIDRADQIISEALGYDLDHDPDYNPKGEKEDDDDIDLYTKNCPSC
jgi:hypothetical protein